MFHIHQLLQNNQVNVAQNNQVNIDQNNQVNVDQNNQVNVVQDKPKISASDIDIIYKKMHTMENAEFDLNGIIYKCNYKFYAVVVACDYNIMDLIDNVIAKFNNEVVDATNPITQKKSIVQNVNIHSYTIQEIKNKTVKYSYKTDTPPASENYRCITYAEGFDPYPWISQNINCISGILWIFFDINTYYKCQKKFIIDTLIIDSNNIDINKINEDKSVNNKIITYYKNHNNIISLTLSSHHIIIGNINLQLFDYALTKFDIAKTSTKLNITVDFDVDNIITYYHDYNLLKQLIKDNKLTIDNIPKCYKCNNYLFHLICSYANKIFCIFCTNLKNASIFLSPVNLDDYFNVIKSIKTGFEYEKKIMKIIQLLRKKEHREALHSLFLSVNPIHHIHIDNYVLSTDIDDLLFNKNPQNKQIIKINKIISTYRSATVKYEISE